jgi:uncharacterized protein (DUF362 family)
MKRRRFLLLGTKAVGAGLIGASGLSRTASRAEGPQASSPAPEPPLPDLVRAVGKPDQALQRALDAIGGIQRFVKPGNVVVVKPNASFVTPPEWGATTHPEVLSALLAICFEAEARRVLVVDHTMGNAEPCFARTGTADAVAAFPDAKLVSLDRENLYRETEIPGAEALHRTAIASVIAKADVFINLPTAKSHSATGVSFGLKNLMGLVWDRHTFHHNMDVHIGIADLATVLKPDLTILDALHLMRTGGPAGPGDVEAFGGVVVGTDPVALDAYAVGLTTWNRQTLKPDQVSHLRRAAQRGLGTLDLTSLKILELT